MNELQYKNLDICHAEGLLNIWADADVIKPLDVFVAIQNGQLVSVSA